MGTTSSGQRCGGPRAFCELARPRVHSAVQASINKVLADEVTARLTRRKKAVRGIVAATATGLLAWWTGAVATVLGFVQDFLLR